VSMQNNLWERIKKRHDELSQVLTDPALDRTKRQEMQKESSHLEALLAKYNHVCDLEQQIAEAQQAAASEDPEMAALFQEEVAMLKEQLAHAHKELDLFIAPVDELDDRSVFIEIRGGAGGQEAALFASDLLRMYTNYALRQGWRAAIESESGTDLGGYREVVLHVQGKGAFGHLKYESGVHRVQRVPATETSGRVHTSTATVAVLPEAEEVDVKINPADLRIDVFRASGAGGQHVNTTDSAVRITHIPSGVVVSCQDERSQLKNKAKAMKHLQARLLAAQIERQQAAMSKMRKEQVGTGMRAEKVRTYNFPQNRVTDHQVNVTLKKLDYVMEGDLGEIVDALREYERHARKEHFLEQFK